MNERPGAASYTARMPVPARAAALEIVRTLREAGHVSYFAGGCVRDELLGLTPSDYDVATDATPDKVSGLFRSVREVGKAFGVSLVRAKGVTVEVTTFRRESEYSDKRRPDAVEFSDAESDARRRDFTINALYIDPLDTAAREGGRVIDFVHGMADLHARLIRAVGNPEARLAEDHLRALRAVRFAARLSFDIDPATADAIARHARDLQGVSRERIGDELRMMFALRTRAAGVRWLHRLGLDGPVLGESSTGPLEPTAVARIGAGASFPLCLAAWAADRRPGSTLERLEQDRAAIARAWRQALCLSNDETDELRDILGIVSALGSSWSTMSIARRKRTAASGSFAPALELYGLLDGPSAETVRADIELLAATRSGIHPVPFVSGDDLIALGYQPGPAFARVLELALDEQLEDRLDSREAAIDWVRRRWDDVAKGAGERRRS